MTPRTLPFATALFTAALFVACAAPAPEPPAPIGALPSSAQLEWHAAPYYAFVHFNMNTFTDEEWGDGREPADHFAPTELDCRQWARVAKEAGMSGIILTAKHHDGFCLWPSEQTEHSVANSSWRDGKGDVLRELSDACREYGLDFGVYLSPWDRNHPDYGSEKYNQVFAAQGVPISLKGFWPCPQFVADAGAPAGLLNQFMNAAFANGVVLYGVSYVNYSHTDADLAEAMERLTLAAASL